MAQDQSENSQHQGAEHSDRQLRALIVLFNWLVGEVITARIMILRLAGDLVRTGVLSIDEVNGMPLTQDIIDSVMGNFPTEPMWQALGQRLRGSLDALRKMDLQNEMELDEDDPEEDDYDDDDPDSDLDDDVIEAAAEVIYRNPTHEDVPRRPSMFPWPRTSKAPGGKQN